MKTSEEFSSLVLLWKIFLFRHFAFCHSDRAPVILRRYLLDGQSKNLIFRSLDCSSCCPSQDDSKDIRHSEWSDSAVEESLSHCHSEPVEESLFRCFDFAQHDKND